MRSLLATLLTCIALAACEGSFSGVKPAPIIPGGEEPPDAGPEKCEPIAHDVPKLLRLSNHEYQAMASDVLGVPLDDALFARWTPVAQVYGFDTMSETRVDAQALEEQLATAENLAALVLATPALTAHCPAVRPPQTPACTLKTSYSALDDFSDAQGRDCWTYLDSSGAPMVFDITRSLWRKEPDQTVLLWRSGAHPGSTVDAVRRWVSPVDGTLTIVGTFGDGDPGGGDGVAVSIRRNGAVIYSQDLANAGPAVSFNLPLTVAQRDQFDFVVNRKTNPNYDSTSFTAAITLTPTPRKTAWTWDNCVQPLVARLASRAFRRPVRDAELADYQALYAASLQGAATAGFTEPVDEALTAVLEALFLSPNFVFKPELVPGGLDANERGFGVASRLGLYLRGSIADEQLWMLASTGGLNTTAAVRAQAERLLDQDLDRFTRNFGGQWLDFREAGVMHPLAATMQRESRDMFSTVLREGRGPEDLLTPGFTIVQGTLAEYYGLQSGGGETAYRLMTPQRGGLLSHGLFLARTGSGSEFRRPIHRGLWVLNRLLCRALPRLDPATLEEIANSFNTIDRTKPLPEQMAAHRDTSTRCGGCHSRMDPIGLALEKYDAQGKWRETYADGTPIVTNLELDGKFVRDPLELAAAVEAMPDYRACVAKNLLTFGMNRGPVEGEACVSERLGSPLDGSKPTLRAMTLDALMKALELTEVKP